jgi:hypothetical protein
MIFSIDLESLVTLRSSGTDILHGCHLLLDVYIYIYIRLKRSFNNRSVTFSRKANLGIDVRHVYKRM